MPKRIPPLTYQQIKSAKPRQKLYTLQDGYGLSLYIYPSGNKVWRLSFTRADKKRDSISLGRFPQYGLRKARQWRTQIHHQLANGTLNRGNLPEQAVSYTLFSATQHWYNHWKKNVTERYATQVYSALSRYILPTLGNKNLADIVPLDIVNCLRQVEKIGKFSLLHRIKTWLKQVFDFAIGEGRLANNVLTQISAKLFYNAEVTHFPALSPTQLPDLIAFLETSPLTPSTRLACYWQLITLTRPTETSRASFHELDFDKQLWVIPKERMKKRKAHEVPMSSAMHWVLRQIKLHHQGQTDYLFEGRKKQNPLDKESVRMALKRSSLPTTAHGLRALGRTYLSESGLWREEIIEAALAHALANKTISAYQRTSFLNERREMMEWWGNIILALVNKINLVK